MRVRAFLLFLFLVLGANPVVAEVGGEAGDQYFKGYLLKNEAERLEQAGDFAEALRKYQEAEQIIARVMRNYPDWQPEVVSYRLKMIRVAEQRLAAKGMPPVPAVPQPEPPTPNSAITPLFELFDEWNALRKRERKKDREQKRDSRPSSPRTLWKDLGFARQVT